MGQVVSDEVHSRGNSYSITDHGAQVTRWSSSRFGELLYVSSAAQMRAGTPIRGGVPICFPWFADGDSGQRRPAHGFLRTARWRRTSWDVNDQHSVLTAVYEIDERDVAQQPGIEQFDYQFTARYDVALAPGHARFTLRITNDGSEAFSFGAALHSYFAISDVHDVLIAGLDGVPFTDRLTSARAVQDGNLELGEQVDRIYDTSSDVVITDNQLARTIRVGTLGASEVVVWNPGEQKAAQLADLGADEWRRFVCVETAATADNAIRLEPGMRHELEQQVFVSGR